MKEIPLTRGKVALVDDEDFEYLSQWQWRATLQKNGTHYAVRTQRKHEPPARIETRTVLMHREVMSATSGVDVDHRNHDQLDNRKANLRLCNRRENSQNAVLRCDATTGLKGVTYCKRWRKYVVHITVECKALHLGGYETAEEASDVYDHAALHYFGEFALLNNPRNKDRFLGVMFAKPPKKKPQASLGKRKINREQAAKILEMCRTAPDVTVAVAFGIERRLVKKIREGMYFPISVPAPN